jgi:hypothetical protein
MEQIKQALKIFLCRHFHTGGYIDWDSDLNDTIWVCDTCDRTAKSRHGDK